MNLNSLLSRLTRDLFPRPSARRAQDKEVRFPLLDRAVEYLELHLEDAIFHLPSAKTVMQWEGEEDWSPSEARIIRMLSRGLNGLLRVRALNSLAFWQGEALDVGAEAETLHVSVDTLRRFYTLKAAVCLLCDWELDEDKHPKAHVDEVNPVASWATSGPQGEYSTVSWTELSVGPGLSNWWYRIFRDSSN